MANPYDSGWLGATTTDGQAPTPARPSREQLVAASRGGIVGWVRAKLGGYLGNRLSPGTPQEKEIREERAASGPRGILLPWTVDLLPYVGLGAPVPHHLLRRMFRDPNVKASLLSQIFGVAAVDLRIIPADKKDKKSHEIADFVQWNLTQRVKGGFPSFVWGLLSGGLVDGHSIQEKVFDLERRSRKWSGNYVVREFKPKDAWEDVILKTDEFRNVVSVMGLKYNGGLEFDPALFVIWQFLPFFNSPVGTSHLSAAYGRWWLLDTVTKLRGMAAEKRYGPVVWGTYPTNNGTVKASLEAALANLKSSNWLTVPDPVKLQTLDVAGQSDEFFSNFCKDLKHDIFLSITGAVLQQIEGSTTDGRGNSEVHKDTGDLWKYFMLNCVCAVLNDPETGVISDLVQLNYPGADCPVAVMGGVDDSELKESLAVDQGLNQMGLALSRDDLYERYGRKPPDTPEDTLPGAQPGQPQPGTPSPGASDVPEFDEAEPVVSAADRPTLPAGATASAKPANSGEVALAGADGKKAAELLRHAKQEGAATLSDITRRALTRLLAEGPHNVMSAAKLFDDAETSDLADAIAATNATAELLGRARIRLRAQQAEKARGRAFTEGYSTFAEEPTDFSAFDEPGPVKPLPPEQAVAHFKRLVPSLNHEVRDFAGRQRSNAFTLAAATDETMLARVKRVIQQHLEAGKHLEADGKLAGGKTVEFVPHPNAGADEVMLLVPTKDLDNAWANDASYYLPPGEGGASEVRGRRVEFQRFLKTGKPVETPRVSLDGGALSVEDGRHRLAVLRDQGINRVGVMVPADQVQQFKQQLGAKEPAGTGLSGPKAVQRILDDAGVSPKNPQYSEMAFRTNMMNSYNEGADAERQDPDVAETFPVWRYVGVRDGRQGKDHEPHFDKYYPNDASFAEVRDSIKVRPFNCRCTQIPIDKFSWAKLQAGGAQVSTFAEKFCGGPGGKPGPCPSGVKEQPKGRQPKAAKPGPAPDEPAQGEPAYKPTVAVKKAKPGVRAFDGKPVETAKISKQDAGKIGENIILAHLHAEGFKDARPLNTKQNNYAIDAVQDHETIEIKTGQVSNGAGAQQWRLTIGEPGKKEKEALKKMSPAQKAKWNARKQKEIHDRKAKALGEIGKELGHPVKAATMTVLLDPGKKVADVYRFDGWHDRIGWNSEEAKKAYVGTYHYQ